MSVFFDLFILVVMALSIWSGWREGFVKSIMGFASAILAFFAAVFFTPYLSVFICDTFIIGPLSAEIAETLGSLLSISAGAAISTSQLFSDMPAALTALFDRFGVNTAEFVSRFSSNAPATTDLVNEMAEAMARPIAETISSVLAFFIIYIVVLVALKIVTIIIGVAFELPVLKQLNEVMGLVFGIICALFYAIVFSTIAVHLAEALSVFDSAMFSPDMIKHTYLVRLFSSIDFSMMRDILEQAK